MFIGFDDNMKMKYIVKNGSIQIGKNKSYLQFFWIYFIFRSSIALKSGSHFALAKNAD